MKIIIFAALRLMNSAWPHGPSMWRQSPPRRSRMERPLGGSEQRCTITAAGRRKKHIYTFKKLHTLCDSVGLLSEKRRASDTNRNIPRLDF